MYRSLPAWASPSRALCAWERDVSGVQTAERSGRVWAVCIVRVYFQLVSKVVALIYSRTGSVQESSFPHILTDPWYAQTFRFPSIWLKCDGNLLLIVSCVSPPISEVSFHFYGKLHFLLCILAVCSCPLSTFRLIVCLYFIRLEFLCDWNIYSFFYFEHIFSHVVVYTCF